MQLLRIGIAQHVPALVTRFNSQRVGHGCAEVRLIVVVPADIARADVQRLMDIPAEMNQPAQRVRLIKTRRRTGWRA